MNPHTAQISTRWRPGHRVYRNDETGEFSEVNSPMTSRTELAVQAAMLAPSKKATRRQINPGTTK